MQMMMQQHQQGRGMNTPGMQRPPFMQSGGMQMNPQAQPNQFVRGAMPNAAQQQQAVRMQHQQMVMQQQQQQQQQMQHNIGQQQHNQHYHQQPF